MEALAHFAVHLIPGLPVYPIGWKSRQDVAVQFNLFIMFVVSGVWHGANWTYVIWGALNGLYLIGSIWTRPVRQWCCQKTTLVKHPTLHNYVRVAVTFLLICVAWVFFRANNLADAWYILTHLGQGLDRVFRPGFTLKIGLDRYESKAAALSIGLMEFVHVIQRHRHIRHMLSERPLWLRWLVYCALFLGIVLLGIFNQQQFIYFQF